jgi:hypothetical protein
LFEGGRITFTDDFTLNIFIGFIMQLVWMQLEDMSFITINSFIAVSITGVPKIILSVIYKFIYFDIFYTEWWMADMMKNLGLDFDLIEKDEPMNLEFSQNGFESMQFLRNIGTTLIFITLYLSAWIILLLL